MLLGEEGDAVIAIGQASHAWISDQFARAAILGVDVITTVDRRRCIPSSPRRRWRPERRDRKLPSARRSQQCDDPRVAVDLQLVDDL
jgi:hypothetical protein